MPTACSTFYAADEVQGAAAVRLSRDGDRLGGTGLRRAYATTSVAFDTPTMSLHGRAVRVRPRDSRVARPI